MIAVTTDILLGALIVALHKTSCFGRNVTLKEHGTQGRENVMDDLIRRQDMIDSILFATADGDKADWVISVINSVPSAEPTWKKCLICGAKIEVDEE